MTEILENQSLLSFNTFGINVKARFLSTAHSCDDFQELFSSKYADIHAPLILGGGSNVLFTNDYNGLVILNRISGIEKILEDENTVRLRVGAGVVWHEFVMHCVQNNWGGVENLSLIPGSVGAGPMQNIGAYGVELRDVFYQLEALHIPTGEVHQFGLKDCRFDYRSSVFKTTGKGQYAILSVEFNLSKKHHLSLSYGSIEQELESMGVNHPTIQDVSQAVINIRKSKLPDPAQIGNAGSFFKNPSIDSDLAEQLKKKYPDMPSYPSTEAGKKKVAAGWLIEKAGFKGKGFGNYGVHKNQALVLVNYGGAAGRDILNLSEAIIQVIHTQFGIELEREVNII